MKIGNRFLIKNMYYESDDADVIYDEYILCLVNPPQRLVNLINLSSGCSWSNPVVVKNTHDITEAEMKELMKEDFDKFIKVRRKNAKWK